MQVEAKELKEKLNNQNSVLLDVRTEIEFKAMHVEGAINIPLAELNSSIIEQYKGKEIYVVCQSGKRGESACEKLKNWGYSPSNVIGGTLECERQGLKMAKDSSVIGLDRQVRIAAGSFVLLGTLLSFIFPAFIYLAVFVGAGLVFSGITNTCGLGMLLTIMPWNKCNRGACCK